MCVGPPNILHIDHSEVSIEGNKSYLTCIATNDEDSNHPLQIQWYNSNGTQVLSDGSRIFVSPNEPSQEKSVVLFDPVNRIDSGVYTCKVFNHFESYSERNFSLNVKCKCYNVCTVYDNYYNYITDICLPYTYCFHRQ